LADERDCPPLAPVRLALLEEGTDAFVRIGGENAYGEAKMRMIADWVEKSGLKGAHGHVRFYSDHVSDRPAFEWADEPVAVNPHRELRRLAEQRGWAVEDWG
jgi:phosphoserine phosphatase